jgi:hypothetical protein
MKHAVKRTALAANGDRILVNPGDPKLLRRDQLELPAGDPRRGKIPTSPRPNKVTKLLERNQFGEILGLRPIICTISDWPGDFVTLFGARMGHYP